MIMWQELQPDDPGRIGPYRLRGILGSGGMGRVFLGASADGQVAAVKVIRADLATDPEFRARFRREVTVARKVSSRFTVPLIDADADSAVPWLATAYVTGPSLADAVTERGPLAVPMVLRLAAGLAEGLCAIHAAGVVHRDLKPSNVLLAHDGPRVIDFGISVAAETSPLTRTGLLVGSPGYMSPEQVEGREVGSPSDIFSLGAVLAFAATGEAPFGSGSAPTLAYRVVYRQVNLDRVPAEVRGLIQRCLTKDPGQRPTARDLMFAADAAAVPPTERWIPEPASRTLLELPDRQDPSRTVTSARLSPVSRPAPGPSGRHEHRRRRLARPLTIASMVMGLLAASTAGSRRMARTLGRLCPGR
jgi:serine/threonine protein kinase